MVAGVIDVNTHAYGMVRGMAAVDRTEARLSRAEWVRVALDALAARGVAGLSVERLARELGVTKGSFYWHFGGRDELLAAALEHWEQAYTEQLIAALADIPDPRERLARLIGQVTRGGQSDRIHLALASEKLPAVRATLARTTGRRIEYLEECYAALGLAPAEAQRSALLAYSAYIGLVHLRIEAPGSLPSRDAFQSYVDFVVERLVPRHGERGGRSRR